MVKRLVLVQCAGFVHFFTFQTKASFSCSCVYVTAIFYLIVLACAYRASGATRIKVIKVFLCVLFATFIKGFAPETRFETGAKLTQHTLLGLQPKNFNS